jgi:hypothetical protein
LRRFSQLENITTRGKRKVFEEIYKQTDRETDRQTYSKIGEDLPRKKEH